jgi:hypothetical protein
LGDVQSQIARTLKKPKGCAELITPKKTANQRRIAPLRAVRRKFMSK